MKNYFLGIAAFLIAVSAVAFKETNSNKDKHKWDGTYFFEFGGVQNSEENDRTKWDYLATQTQTAYDALACPGSLYGCKLIAKDTVHISGMPRPKTVYVQSGTKKPITGTDVLEVKNIVSP